MVEAEINRVVNLARAPPQPGILLVLTALVLLAVDLLIATLGCVVIFISLSPFSLIGTAGGSIWICFAAYLAWELYRAVFRAHLHAAQQAAISLKVAAILLAIAFVVVVIRQVLAPEPFLVHILTVGILVLLFFAAAAWQAQLWATELHRAGIADGDRASQRFTLREGLLAITAAAVVCAGSSYLHRQWQPRLAEHVPATNCPFELPAGASDVSYCYSAWDQLAYEFTIDEMGAQSWAAGLDLYYMQPAKGLKMPRYGSLHPRLQRSQNATIAKGWQSAGYVDGRQVMIAYDQQAERAYYFTEAP